MSKLGIKTRGNSSPQGKSRVYFCCHPNDFETYFEEIAGEILARYNCVICYEENPETAFDEGLLLSDLERMQLFVVPITSDFLYQGNRALNLELPFAKKKHIPILPLLQNADLAQDFNRICGDLQYLDKHMKDDTGISYEKKLDRFLSAVLVSDETANRVRNAFDAYIFLSYRKKDRQHANKLMQIIHKNVFCRDVAIWYDEYLSPGENFNDSIEGALRKSELFLMTVTPNLVNEENYVSGKEYPLANKLGKPILSIEMIETDEEKMKERFEGLTDVIPYTNEAAITKALCEKVRYIDLWSKAHFPEHDYLIGLAYLNGIDVEIDSKKAIELIEGAADRGWPEAIDKMVEIYRNGIGVEKDTEKMLHWQEKRIELTEKQFKEEQIDFGTLLSDMMTLAEDFSLSEEFDKAIEQYNLLILRVKKASWTQLFMLERLMWIGHAYAGLGEAHVFMNDYSGAREYLKKSIRLRKILSLLKYYTYVDLDLSTSYLLMGNSYWFENNYTEAQKYFDMALDIRIRLDQEENSSDSSYNLELTYARLGNCFKDAGNYEQAIMYFEKAVERGCVLYAEEQSADSAKKLCWRLDDLGDIYFSQEDYMPAIEYYKKSLELKELHGDNSALDTRRNLGMACLNLGGRLSKENTDQANASYKESLDYFESVFRETQDDDDYFDVAVAMHCYGHALHKKGDSSYLQKALSIVDSLIKGENPAEYMVMLREQILKALKSMNLE